MAVYNTKEGRESTMEKKKELIRTFYLDKLRRVVGTSDIKVLTGCRRTGKSTILSNFIDYVRNEFPDANIVNIDFSLIEFEHLREYKKLNEFVESHYIEGKENFVFIDEVQMCKNFELVVNSFHASKKYDIYITGSNAFLLNSDLATLFTGRTFNIDVYPFSFKEFLEYFEYEDKQTAFEEYRKIGGMPGSYAYDELEEKYSYLNGVMNTVILRDIAQKYGVRNSSLLERLNDYLIDNVSNLVSMNKTAKTLQSNNIETNDKTCSLYVSYLCNAFMFYKMRRYDVRGKKYLSSNEKYYLVDTSFRHSRLGLRNPDFGRLSENIVAIELLRRGYQVYAGVLYSTEIDFVAMNGTEKIYIQVAEYIDNPETFAREYKPLLSIKDAYEKIILAKTRHEEYTYEGIKIIDIADWLSRTN